MRVVCVVHVCYLAGYLLFVDVRVIFRSSLQLLWSLDASEFVRLLTVNIVTS